MPINVYMHGGAAASRRTQALPTWAWGAQAGAMQATRKPTPWNLRRFSESPIPRAAINAIKNPVASLGWEIRPIEGAKKLPYQKQRIQALTASLRQPNEDDSWRSMAEQVVEDVLVGAYGSIEVEAGALERPLWLWPVDGSSIKLYAGWTGAPDEARYAQDTGLYGQVIPLRNDQLIYIKTNPRTHTPFGLSPLEVAFETINHLLGATASAGKTASNQTPRAIVNLGEGVGPEQVSAFRLYWRNEVEGRGNLPIIGGGAAPSVIPLFKGDDSDMRLAWQEFLIRIIGASFGLSPLALGLERDVNRNTAEAMADADRAKAIKPMASLLAEHLNREAIHRKLGWTDLELVWTDLEREDEERESRIDGAYLDRDVYVPDEIRARKGLKPLPGGWGAISASARKVLIAQAAGTGAEVVNPALQDLLADPHLLPDPAGTPTPGDPADPKEEAPDAEEP